VATKAATRILVRDELIGFARSKVMLVLWAVLPALALAGYFLLKDVKLGPGADGAPMPATTFMSMLISSITGTMAALMVAVDLVSERQRKVYELLIIRPVRREVIVWAKFIAVFLSVTIACVISLLLGIGVDAVRGQSLTDEETRGVVRATVTMVTTVGMSAAMGALLGVLARTILVAVLLILYVGQNLAFIPMAPVYFGVFPDRFWLVQLVSVGIIIGALALAGRSFARSQF